MTTTMMTEYQLKRVIISFYNKLKTMSVIISYTTNCNNYECDKFYGTED